MENYENKNRRRYFGLRCGDTVVIWSPFPEMNGVYGVIIGMANFGFNRIFVFLPGHGKYDYPAEWCEIVEKVEDRGQIHAPAY